MVDFNDWEMGALAALRKEPMPDGAAAADFRHGFYRARWLLEKWLAWGRYYGSAYRLAVRLMAVWLEYLASEREFEAAEESNLDVEQQLVEEAEAYRISARAIRRKLLGEVEGA